MGIEPDIRRLVDMAKKGRRTVGGAAATQEQHPPTIRDNLSVLTVRDRKTVQCQREQPQAMPLPMQGKKRSATTVLLMVWAAPMAIDL
jgi:hypothetical protein